MCLPTPPGHLATDAMRAMLDAVSAVAERNFFAVVERCDPQTFDARMPRTGAWLAAAVVFREAGSAGAVSCELPEHLADALFDAFIGRDPLDPPPAPSAVDDLIGQFTNTICGLWLTQIRNRRTFTLARPVVQRRPSQTPYSRENGALLLLVNNEPVSVQVHVGPSTGAPGDPDSRC